MVYLCNLVWFISWSLAPALALQSACLLELEHNVRSAVVMSQSTPAPNASWYSVLLQTSQLCASINNLVFFAQLFSGLLQESQRYTTTSAYEMILYHNVIRSLSQNYRAQIASKGQPAWLLQRRSQLPTWRVCSTFKLLTSLLRSDRSLQVWFQHSLRRKKRFKVHKHFAIWRHYIGLMFPRNLRTQTHWNGTIPNLCSCPNTKL
jgi:hypothetical protein